MDFQLPIGQTNVKIVFKTYWTCDLSCRKLFEALFFLNSKIMKIFVIKHIQKIFTGKVLLFQYRVYELFDRNCFF